MQRNGILWQLSPIFKPLCKQFYSFFGMVWIMSMHTFPFLMTIIKNAILSFPRSISDATDVYCKGKTKGLFRVYGPILASNFSIGAFLVFVKALSEYGTPATFGPKIGVTVFTTSLTNYMQVAPIDFSKASAMASALMSICVLIWALQMVITSKKSYALSSDGKKEIKKNHLITVLSVIFIAVIFFFSTFIPLYTIIISSFKKITYKPAIGDNFTLENYKLGFLTDEGFGTGFKAISNSLLISLLSCTLILLMGITFSIYTRKHKKMKIVKGIEFFDNLPQLIPNIVTGIGFIMFYSLIYKVLPIYRTLWILVIAYSIIFLPNMVNYIKNSLMQMPESLIEAGKVYTSSDFKINTRIILPQALKGAFYGFVMTFIITLRELVTAKLLQPPSFYTISLFIDFQFNQGNQQAAMALAAVSVFLTIAILLPLEYLMTKRKKTK